MSPPAPTRSAAAWTARARQRGARLLSPPVAVDGPLAWRIRARLVLEVVLAYGELAPVVRSNDIRRMVAAARRRPAAGFGQVPPAGAHQVAGRLGWIVRATFDHLPMDSRCLIRSLVLLRLLARRGIQATLVIGVIQGSEFSAHAWVERDDRTLLPAGRAVRLAEF